MTFFAVMFYMGGVYAAYHLNRRFFGVIRSSFEAFMWPFGLGFSIANIYYDNEDWPEKDE